MSAPNTPEAPGPWGFEDFDVPLGDVMRGERATLGKSLLDVQRELKIKAAYLAAIENSDPGAFETPGFVAGYVRSYARYLGMDPDWTFRRFCTESDFSPTHGIAGPASKHASAAPGRPANAAGDALFARSGPPFLPSRRPVFAGIEPGAIGSVVVLVALICAIGYGGFAVFREVQKVQFAPVEPAPEVVAQVDPLAAAFEIANAEDVEGDVATRPTEEDLSRLYRPEALDVAALTPRDGPIASLDPDRVGTFSRLPDSRNMTPLPGSPSAGQEAAELFRTSIDSAVMTALTDAQDSPEPEPEAEQQAQPEPAGEDEPREVMIFAVQPSWIRVRGPDGAVLFEKILDAHEEYVVPETDGAATLRAGNAGSLYFSVGGQTYGPAGEGPSVVKNVELTPASLSSAYALADPDDDGDLAEYYAVADARQEEAPGTPRTE